MIHLKILKYIGSGDIGNVYLIESKVASWFYTTKFLLPLKYFHMPEIIYEDMNLENILAS